MRKDIADDENLAVGDTLRLLTPSATEFEVVVRGIYEPAELDSLLGHVLVSQQAFDRVLPAARGLYSFVTASSRLRRSMRRSPPSRTRSSRPRTSSSRRARRGSDR